MRVVFDPLARAELDDAVAWYDTQRQGLGAEFRLAVRDAVNRLQRRPLACPLVKRDVRRMLLSRFPYKLLFSIETEYLYVLALAHHHRAPDHWIHRRPPK